MRSAPPAGWPSASERHTCARFLDAELAALDGVRTLVCLGALAWNATVDWAGVRPRPPFGHSPEHRIAGGRTLLGCYHPSPQNTRTGRLTAAMLDDILTRAVNSGDGR